MILSLPSSPDSEESHGDHGEAQKCLGLADAPFLPWAHLPPRPGLTCTIPAQPHGWTQSPPPPSYTPLDTA